MPNKQTVPTLPLSLSHSFALVLSLYLNEIVLHRKLFSVYFRLYANLYLNFAIMFAVISLSYVPATPHAVYHHFNRLSYFRRCAHICRCVPLPPDRYFPQKVNSMSNVLFCRIVAPALLKGGMGLFIWILLTIRINSLLIWSPLPVPHKQNQYQSLVHEIIHFHWTKSVFLGYSYAGMCCVVSVRVCVRVCHTGMWNIANIFKNGLAFAEPKIIYSIYEIQLSKV